MEDSESEIEPTGTICIEYDVVTGQHYYVDSTDGSRWTRTTPYAQKSTEDVVQENDQNDHRLLRQSYRTVKVTPTAEVSPSPSKTNLSTAISSTEKGVAHKSVTGNNDINAGAPSPFKIPELDLGRPFTLDVYRTMIDAAQSPALILLMDGSDPQCVPDYDKSLPPAPSRSCETAVRKYLR
ncbi:hypothetical protein BJ912DRAFT_923869 [Pholiota molesta]|nr:hypothetical protein BJ912DRAFT_923869 [Pholiota molesta]